MGLVTTRQKQSVIGHLFAFLLFAVVALLPYTITRSILLAHGTSEGAANAWGWVAEVVLYGIPLVLGIVWVLLRRLESKSQTTK